MKDTKTCIGKPYIDIIAANVLKTVGTSWLARLADEMREMNGINQTQKLKNEKYYANSLLVSYITQLEVTHHSSYIA